MAHAQSADLVVVVLAAAVASVAAAAAVQALLTPSAPLRHQQTVRLLPEHHNCDHPIDKAPTAACHVLAGAVLLSAVPLADMVGLPLSSLLVVPQQALAPATLASSNSLQGNLPEVAAVMHSVPGPKVLVQPNRTPPQN